MRLALHEVRDQYRQVLESLAQRWHLYGKNRQSIEQILAEPSRADGRIEITMSRCDDPDVTTDRAVATHAFETALLQYAQQLDLHLQRHIADLIQEQRPALGELEATESSRERSRECALLVTEEFALQEVRRDRTAIDRNERMPSSTGEFVDMPRHHLFARARFAENQHARIERSDLLDQPVYVAHGARRTAGSKVMRAWLHGVAVAHILRLSQYGRQPALLHGKIQMEPCKIAAGLGDLG